MIQRRPSTCISSGEGGAAVLAHGLQQRAVVADGVWRAHRVQGALAARRVIDVDSFHGAEQSPRIPSDTRACF
jgi:hypothetical protein